MNNNFIQLQATKQQYEKLLSASLSYFEEMCEINQKNDYFMNVKDYDSIIETPVFFGIGLVTYEDVKIKWEGNTMIKTVNVFWDFNGIKENKKSVDYAKSKGAEIPFYEEYKISDFNDKDIP